MMRTSQCARILTALVAVLSLAGMSDAATGESAPEKPRTGRWSWQGPSTGHEHWVHVPDDYAATAPCPILVMSHGVNSSGKGMINGRTCQMAVERGWIAVAPTWNWRGDGAGDWVEVAGEITELLRELIETYPVDRRFVVSSGFSGGGGVSIGSFTRSPELYTLLVSQSSNFHPGYAQAPRRRLSGADRRPVLVLWGEKDHPLILDQGPKEKAYFERKGHPVSSHVVPGGRHRTFPEHAWIWLDTLVLSRRARDLSKAHEAARSVSLERKAWRVAQLLAPFCGREIAPEPSRKENDDPFLEKWTARYRKLAEPFREKLRKAKELYEKAVKHGRRNLEEASARFDEQGKSRHLHWLRRFKKRWVDVPELCAEADAAWKKVYGDPPP